MIDRRPIRKRLRVRIFRLIPVLLETMVSVGPSQFLVRHHDEASGDRREVDDQPSVGRIRHNVETESQMGIGRRQETGTDSPGISPVLGCRRIAFEAGRIIVVVGV